MATAPMSFEALMVDWVEPPLNDAWVAVVRECVAVLGNPTARANAAMRAWQQLAMLFGDSGAPELCVVTATHAMSIDPEDAALSATLRSHANLALMDLGLAAPAVADRPVAIAQLDTQVRSTGEQVAAWLGEFVAPFGTAANAAAACLGLASMRAGLTERPDPLTLEALIAAARKR
jgi:hypothetical protein